MGPPFLQLLYYGEGDNDISDGTMIGKFCVTDQISDNFYFKVLPMLTN